MKTIKIISSFFLCVCLLGCQVDKEEDVIQNNEEVEVNEYIFDTSSEEVLSSIDLCMLTSEELRIARNEVYARHGYIFESSDLNEYFNEKSWYQESTSELEDITLSYIEQQNVELISEIESIMEDGCEISISAWKLEDIKIEDNKLIVCSSSEGMQTYQEYIDSWDFLATTEISFELASDCQWAFSSPSVFQGDYSENVESTQTEVLESLQTEIADIAYATSMDNPYDTSVSVMIVISEQKVTHVFRVSA